MGRDPAVEEFADAAWRAFDAAHASSATGAWSLYVAGHSVHLRIAGSALAARFLPALDHLVAGPSPSPHDITIGCWDRMATGVAPPPPPWTADAVLPRGRVRGHTQHAVRMTYDHSMRMFCVYDSDARRALVHVADAALIPAWVDRAPLRSILTWWASDLGIAFLHAGSVADDRGAVVLAGASGSGKSTTAMACLADGMHFIGDDACLVRLDGRPTVHTMYRRAKLERDAAARLPAVAELAVDTMADSVLIDPGARVVHSAPLRAVLLPRIADAERSCLTPVTSAEARRVLVPATMLEGSGAGASTLRAITRLVGAVPCFRLELGRDLGDVVATVRRALEAA
jgi:hypothetical protein